MKPLIEINRLGKKYQIRTTAPYLSLRDAISNGLGSLWNKSEKTTSDFWALQDIDFKVEAGERVGIIGRNGAGKSTLLKILSRVTWPTTGEAIVRGRLSSLLEVGTGFHPELSGRENIYLNGSILGLRRKEIDRQFDAIVDFSGVETFLEMPLKHYSSGMQLRLAFAVAAHLEPEILIIDEVLAVGDTAFQKKCIGKMEEVSKQDGRTILFVSHNIAILKLLCSRGLLLENGKISYDGNMQSCTDLYTAAFVNSHHRTGYGQFNISHHPNKANNNSGLLRVDMFVNDKPSEEFVPGCSLMIKIKYKIDVPLIDPEIGIVIKDSSNEVYLGLNNKHLGEKLNLKTGEDQYAVITIPKLNIFRPGKYVVDLFFGDNQHFYECLYNCFEFTIPEYDVYNTGLILNAEFNKIYIEHMTIKT